MSTIEALCFNYRKTKYASIDSRNWKHAYAYVMLTDHMPNSNDVAQKPSNFYIFFFMQRINYIFIKKERNLCDVLRLRKRGGLLYINMHIKISLPNIL